jgi:hypothetical protein
VPYAAATMSRTHTPWASRIVGATLAVVAVVAVLALPPAPSPSAAAPAPDDLTGPWNGSTDGGVRGDDAPIDGLAGSLQDDAEPDGASAAGAPADPVTVVVEADDPAAAHAAVADVGGTVVREAGGLVKADVRPERLADLAAADGVRRVSEPRPVLPDVTSEGITSTQSAAWQGGGFGGSGTRVAVIDGGFTGYAARIGTELPAGTVVDLTRCGGSDGGSVHGTAVAEIVHDTAPDAAILLICIDDHIDFIDALDDLPADVDVVNGSFGFTLLDRGDGSGPVSAAVARARDRGVLYVAAAGNSEFTHHHQNATGDAAGNDFDDFVNLPGGDDALAFGVAPGGQASVSLQWDAWPTTALDFDLYIVTNEDPFPVAESIQVQNGNDPPIEGTFVNNPSGVERIYFVIIDRFAGSGTPRLDLYINGDVTGIEAPTSSSVSDPAVSPAALAVGAHCYATSAAAPYSSRGPTIDGRIKPDISGPDGTTSSVYGAADGCTESGFFGTSAAAPHVAGAAAQVLEANSGLDVAELQQILQDRALEAGVAGRDSTFGSGLLRLGPTGAATVPTPQAFTGTTPVRLFDSRPGTPFPSESPDRTTPLPGNGKVRVRVREIAGVPADATAVVLNITAVAPTAAGYLTVHPGGTLPTASNLNFAKGQTVAVHVTATVADDDKVEIYNATGSTHVIVDLAGWYGPTGSSGPSTDRLTLLPTPGRALDSRPGPLGYAEAVFGGSGRTTPIPEGDTLAVSVAGLGGVPAEATAVVMNVTAVGPSTSTFITAYPDGQALPTASNVNLKAGQVVANLVVVPVGPDGVLRFFNAAGNTHLIIDVTGWYQPGVGAGYVALDPPTRNLDTRSGTGLRRGALGPGGTHKLKVARYNGVPADAAAVMLGVVAVGPTASGYLTVYPGSASLPATSSLNFGAGATVANAVIARIGTDGRVAFTNASGSTHVISDLAGYFLDPANVPIP